MKEIKLNTKNLKTYYEIVEKYDLLKEAKERASKIEEIKKKDDNTLMKFMFAQMNEDLSKDRALQMFEGYEEFYKQVQGKEPADLEEAKEFFSTFRKKINPA